MWVAFANAKATHIFFFSKNTCLYAIFNDQSFNDTLTNYIVGFEQLGPDLFWDRVAIFDQLGLISDPHLNFQKPRNGLNDYKELENIYIALQSLRKHTYSNILQPKKGKFSDKKIWYFSYFCSKT